MLYGNGLSTNARRFARLCAHLSSQPRVAATRPFSLAPAGERIETPEKLKQPA